MTQLRYVGPGTGEVGCVPLPEGWPAADHEEADETATAAKLAFRLARPGDAKGTPTGPRVYEAVKAAKGKEGSDGDRD